MGTSELKSLENSIENYLSMNQEVLKKVENIAKLKSVTPAQIALAWVLSKGSDVFPFTGTKKIKYCSKKKFS